MARGGVWVGGRSGTPAVGGASMSLTVRRTDLAGLEVATKVLYPAVSLSGRLTGEAAAPACPRYLVVRRIPGCG